MANFSGVLNEAFRDSVELFQRQCVQSREDACFEYVEHKDSEIVLFDEAELKNFPTHIDINVNNVFTTKCVLQNAICMLAVRNSFEFITVKSNKTRYRIRCKDLQCLWLLYANVNPKSGMWVIKTFYKEHTCFGRVVIHKNKHASSRLISMCVKDDFRGSLANEIKPAGVAEIMRTRWNVEVSYFQAWKGRKSALIDLRGDFDSSYSHLPIIGRMICEKNPGSYSFTEVDDDGTFKYFFLAFGASVHGFQFCRPVISVDGTFLKGKSYGTLLLATAQDGDNHLFPLAFSIVDSENDNSWSWFMRQLRSVFGVRQDMVIVSDRHKSIQKSVNNVFPEVLWASCMQHLWGNVKAQFGSSNIQPLFYKCAKAYTSREFDFWLNLLSSGDRKIKKYLLNANPELWSRSHFSGKRFNIMTTNISECLNAVLHEARGWPVACLVLSYRDLIQRWIVKKRALIPKMVSGLTNIGYQTLKDAQEAGRCMNVNAINENQFEIVDGAMRRVVDVEQKSCTCRFWQLEDLPCSHACAALYRRNLFPIDYVSPYFRQDFFCKTYELDVFPISHEGDWSLPFHESVIKPPCQKRQAGRPKEKRYRSKNEKFHPYIQKCGKCGHSGHNKRGCISKKDG